MYRYVIFVGGQAVGFRYLAIPGSEVCMITEVQGQA